jgi:hypothetical protein
VATTSSDVEANPVSHRSFTESPGSEAAAQRSGGSGPPEVEPPAPNPSGAPQPVPVISGARSSYYLFQGGQRMAVAMVDRGGRLRVNDAIDVVVLEIYNGAVKIGLVDRCSEEDEG